jgi:hypothetical protein
MYMDATLINNIVLLLIGLVGIYTAYQAKQTKIASEKTEVNTNSMREQLVKATGVASHAAGRAEGIAESEAKTAILAKGILKGMEEK